MSSLIRFIKPCSPIRTKEPPAGDAWLHEPKLDGYRLQVVKNGRQVRLYSRRGNDWTSRLAELAEALTAIPVPAVILDAELCLAGADWVADFHGLQAAIDGRQQHELAVFAFDILHQDGTDMCSWPLTRRKQILASLVERAKVGCLHVVASFPDGAKLLASAERLGLEGVVSKRRSAPYRSGECRNWRNARRPLGVRRTGSDGDCSIPLTA
jgi:bifunctional non-homologous end joining protein LigD